MGQTCYQTGPDGRSVNQLVKIQHMNPILSTTAVKAILNNAPLIIQGAGKLIQLIKDKNTEPQDSLETPVTLQGLQEGLENLELRLDTTDESNIEQIKLIEELAKQNATMAESLNKTYSRINQITIISLVAIVLGLLAILFSPA